MPRICLRPGACREERHSLRLVSYRGGHLPASRERDRRLAVASDGAVCDFLFRGGDGRGGGAGISPAYQGVEGHVRLSYGVVQKSLAVLPMLKLDRRHFRLAARLWSRRSMNCVSS